MATNSSSLIRQVFLRCLHWEAQRLVARSSTFMVRSSITIETQCVSSEVTQSMPNSSVHLISVAFLQHSHAHKRRPSPLNIAKIVSTPVSRYSLISRSQPSTQLIHLVVQWKDILKSTSQDTTSMKTTALVKLPASSMAHIRPMPPLLMPTPCGVTHHLLTSETVTLETTSIKWQCQLMVSLTPNQTTHSSIMMILILDKFSQLMDQWMKLTL